VKKTKGHWPKGKRRHSPRGWPILKDRLALYVRERATLRATAADVGVHERTLRRWLSGEDFPAEESASLDRLPLDADAGREWIFTAWTAPRRKGPHKSLERPCWYRRVSRIPWLKSRSNTNQNQ
jgi:hypothetical protein